MDKLSHVLNKTMDAINQIEAFLRHDNSKNKSCLIVYYYFCYLVRIQNHALLEIIVLTNIWLRFIYLLNNLFKGLQLRKLLKRLEKSVHVLCILADTIAKGQSPATV